MNSLPETLHPLATIVDALIGCTERLLGLLAEEHKALLARDIEALGCVVRAKGAAANELQQLERRLQAAAGPGGVPPSFQHRLAAMPGGAPLAARWLELGRLARQANDANLANGALLDARERQVRGALAALQPDKPPVYGRGGYSRPSFSHRVHGSA